MRKPITCSCGKFHKNVPANARYMKDDSPLSGHYWECQCKSTLFYPAASKEKLTAPITSLLIVSLLILSGCATTGRYVFKSAPGVSADEETADLEDCKRKSYLAYASPDRQQDWSNRCMMSRGHNIVFVQD